MNEKSLSRNLKKWKITLLDKDKILSTLNDFLYKYIKYELIAIKKKIKQNGGRTVLPLEYFGINSKNYYSTDGRSDMLKSTNTVVRPAIVRQNGGRVVLPSEYFGTASQCYYNDPPSGEVMNQPTNTVIRPSLNMNVSSLGQVGGGLVKISKIEIEKKINLILNEIHFSNLKMKTIVVKKLKDSFEKILDELFDKFYGKEINDSIIKKQLNQKKFHKYYKKT